mmetsp:Transcript_31274/g.93893  ORF Transcript_31274/g.93893 Transcript_31274/m.93893 type:complete len:573 (+) Transcript_31274:177-1895(+)
MSGLHGDHPPPVVVAGPSGVGKGTLIGMLMKEFPDHFGFSISHTTRDPRPGETDGVEYHFTDRETMAPMIEAGDFIESADVHGHFYGTSKAAVSRVQRQSKICILDIDVQGVRSVKAADLAPAPRFIFVKPPSMEELESRLRGRGTETEEKIQRRLTGAEAELAFADADGGKNFDLVIVNDDLDLAFAALKEGIADILAAVTAVQAEAAEAAPAPAPAAAVPAAVAAAAPPDPPDQPLGDVFVGTAGYSYAWWRKGAFYPRGLVQASELKHFSGTFPTVEINSSFHGVPREETLAAWAAAAKRGFRFALKVPQDITHVKRLANAEDSIRFFVTRVMDKLGVALGPVLFQLPPSLSKDVAKVHAVAQVIPAGLRVAWEFRHASWYCTEVYDALRAHNFAICENRSTDKSTLHTTEVTADWCYTRFHKNAGQTITDWPTAMLREAAAEVTARRNRGLNQFMFFLNDHEANSPRNAKTLLAEVAALSSCARPVAGWKADAVVQKGGKGSIQAMFAGAKAKGRPATAGSAGPSRARPADPSISSPPKRARTADNGTKSPAKSPAATGNIMSFFKKK